MAKKLDYREYWEKALPWSEYLEREIEEQRELWTGVYGKTRIPEGVVRRAGDLEEDLRVLVLAEDWCGDAANTVPVLARLGEEAERLAVRILDRDDNPELMDRFLTDGSRSIPVAILLGADFEPVGSWGPRPRELQEFVISEKRAGERPSSEIYKDARRWYAKDAGRTTLEEFLETAESSVLACG